MSMPRRASSKVPVKQWRIPPKPVGSSFFENTQAVGPRIAAVHDEGQLGRAGQFQLLPKDAFLHVTRGMVVIIIETDFAPGNHFGMLRQPGQRLQAVGVTSWASWGWIPTVV